MHIDDGYPIHNIFAIIRKLIVENFDTDVHQHEKPINGNYENFSNRAHRHQPDNENAREIYNLMTLNSYRMMALFVQEYIANNGVPSGSEQAEERVARWQGTLDHFERFTEEVQGPKQTYNLKLISDVRIAILEG